MNNKLVISTNGRFIQNETGDPFFFLADTGWELFHRLTLEEIKIYFETRKNQGFNVIQCVLISEMDGLRTPNAYGSLPFQDLNPDKPNPVYFEFVDEVLRIAESMDLYLAMVPLWGDKVDRIFGIGPELFNKTNAGSYGKWLGKRYMNFPNIIWMNGGDRSGEGKNFGIWDSLGKGIRSEDSNHIMTFHPLGDASSSMWFHNSDWLDFNSCQSGHSMRNYPNYMMITYDYLRKPVKPCIDSEPHYEEHAVNWKPEENGVFDDYDVRQAAYWSVFAGACGHTYGSHPVWQMHDNQRVPIGFVRYTWKEALNLKGASQLVHLKNLMLSRPYFERIPDQSLLILPKVGDEAIRCTRGENYAFIYLPLGGEIVLKSNILNYEQINAWWFDPRNGESTVIGLFKETDVMTFKSPSQGRGCDWILVIDNTKFNFGKPGTF